MLQKLEDVYLAILRTAVIMASGILLVGFVVFGLSALKGFGSSPGDKASPPRVDPGSIIERITEPDTSSEPAQGMKQGLTPEEMVPDPNQKHYAHTAARISKFVKTVSDGAENVDEALAENIIRERANTYGSDELISSYAEELSKSISRAVMNTSIITAARNTSAIDVINHILSVFTEEFDRELQAEHQRFSEEQAAHLEARSDATNTMYLAGVCFGLFLLIVFLSIFIKIERNLRHLQPGAPRKDGNVP